MFIASLAKNADIIAASLGAVAVFGMFVVFCWPFFSPNAFRDRLRRIANDSNRNRGPAGTPGDTHLTTQSKQIFKDIVVWMNLTDQAEDGEVVRKLRMAGYRGQGPVVTFLAIRLLAAPAIFAITSVYVFVLLPLDYPFFVKLAMVTAASLLGYFIPAVYVQHRIGKRQKAIRHTWPDALDLVLICVEAGMGIERAFQKVSEEIGVQSVILADELGLTTAELSYLPERRKAYENLAMRTGLESVRSVVTTLVQAEKFGTALGPALRVLAQENRQVRMNEAEKKAATLPPKLTVPMIVFFLPVLFAVIIAPAVIQITTNL
jgi:tight adherence protein C